ncbi:cobQ/CobB/MinD/ParA nucleotide binding domain protein [Burkholderia cenocepacia]|uniref:CobQ/CobB/MinD/ParA nucleotide binding domain protein n=1 Tax=Burkholderia cenocepacia TaxID=95486 RepID=A0AAN0RPC4_9BURK|nr:cobQ/CobB/MinD/ParA nucleotide binding domain protein [Burkholderia cenocepacia]
MAEARIVSLINMKGGVGKTTLAVGLAWELAKHSRVLLVDIDPQFNATQWLVDTAEYLNWVKTKHTILSVFQPPGQASIHAGAGGAPVATVKPTAKTTIIQIKKNGTKLDLLPSILDLMKLDAAPRGTENRLRVFLEKVRGDYDYILIDCPPTASLFSYSAFLASDAYLVPVKPDPLSVLGLPLLERAMLDYEERSGQELPRLGLIFTQVRQTDAMKATMAQVRRDYPGEVFQNMIVQTTGVAEAVEANTPVQFFNKGGKLAEVRDALTGICAEFVARVSTL